VFLHPAQDLLDAALAALEPDYAQLDVADLDTLHVPAGQKVLPVLRSTAPQDELEAAARRHGLCLLESGRSGAGERADWNIAARLAAQGGRLVLAGGLDPRNVAEAVRTVRPFGVDVSSGVESAPGDKDPQLMMEFVAAARAAFPRLLDEDSARGTR
jgi:phosphoribosylanthranilate isomerase